MVNNSHSSGTTETSTAWVKLVNAKNSFLMGQPKTVEQLLANLRSTENFVTFCSKYKMQFFDSFLNSENTAEKTLYIT